MRPRVVITGVGVVSPLGATLRDTCDALEAGRTAVGPVTGFDASGCALNLGAEIRNFDPRPSFVTPKAIKMTDRAAQFAVVAAREALNASGWRDGEGVRPLGVLMGTSGHDLLLPDIAGAIGEDDAQRAVHDTAWCGERLRSGMPPLWLLTVLPNMISAHVAMQTSASGPCSTLMSAEAAGLQAIGEAAEWIWSGEADAVIAGGSDSGVNPFVYMAFEQAGVTDVPAEGAGVFVVERRDRAIDRGAPVHAELLAYTCTGSGRDACERAVSMVCADGGITRDRLRWTVGDVRYNGVPHITFADQLGNALAASVPIALAAALPDAPSRDYTDALVAVCGTTGPSVAMALRLGPYTEQ